MNPKNPNNSSIPRLITIAVSHYCEKARWALDWLKIPYIEENHVPVFNRFYTIPYGGKSTPLLVTETGNFVDSTEILHYLNSISPENRRLYPKNPLQRQEVNKLEDLFDRQLGISTRSWAYFYVLDRPKVVREIWCKGVPKLEKIGCAIAFPLLRSMVSKACNSTSEGAARSLSKIKEIFAKVEKRLEGQKYLVGDSFTAADLTFAALSAPVIRPAEHPIMSSELRGLPEEMLNVIQELRSTPAGKYALHLYREMRETK